MSLATQSRDRSLLDSPAAVWEREYTHHRVIPTSTRKTPSRALLLFEHLLLTDGPLTVLDIGAGIGRNAVYLAGLGHTVYAVDFSPSALSALVALRRAGGVAAKVHPVRASLTARFPFRDEGFDLILDSYVFCHFIDAAVKHHLMSEIDRVLSPTGLFYSSLFSPRDEYYRGLIADREQADPVVIDPRNGIAKQLYERESIRAFYSRWFTPRYLAEFEFEDVAVGSHFWRSVLVMLMEK